MSCLQADVSELQSLIEKEYPGRPVLRCSAKTGEGFGALVETLALRGPIWQTMMEVITTSTQKAKRNWAGLTVRW